MIYVFTGNGKGKTTAAIGMAIRFIGAGKKVLMIQFMKAKNASSETAVLREIKGVEIKSFGRVGFYLPKSEIRKNPKLAESGVKPFEKKDFDLAEEGLRFAEKKLAARKSGKISLVILDEINVAANYKLLPIKSIIAFIKKWGKEKDIVLTGRYCPKRILAMADLVTEMKEVKHYYNKGIKARKGAEF